MHIADSFLYRGYALKQTMGYILALFLGLFIGWLAQQFWFFGRDADATLPSERNLARFQSRLESLKRQPEMSEKVSPAIEILAVTESPIDKLLAKKEFDASIAWYQSHAIGGHSSEAEDLSLALKIAELGFSRQQYEQLLFFLYDVRLQLDATAEQSLLKDISLLVERIDKQLTEEQEVQRLVDIYRLLISLEADNTYYYLRLCYWLIQAGEIFQAKEALIGAKNDILYRNAFQELETLIEQTENGQLNYFVPLTKAGEHYLVAVTLNGAFDTQLMLDTGASKTVLKRNVADQFLSANELAGSIISLTTANGKAQGLSLSLSRLQLGEADLSEIDIVVMDLPSFRHDGLLGMNVLNKFEFSIDQANSQLILRPKLHASILPR